MIARPIAILAGAAALLLAGCESIPSRSDSVYHGPFYQPRNFVGEAQLPTDVRRVVVLPVSAGSIAPGETAEALDAVVVAALQKQQRFEVVSLTRDECRRWFGADAFSSTAALPHQLLSRIAAKFAADAVIFVDVTVYQPYRPQSLGLRAKLATVRDVRLLWTFDEVMSAADPAVANSARRQFLKTDRGTQPLDLSPHALQSPGRFAAFAAETMFGTLPPR
ncbi:MAG: hypothetical protein C0518_11725 [Opitutus sp.]|nr:hypothetical protein [Opitutus sp.]